MSAGEAVAVPVPVPDPATLQFAAVLGAGTMGRGIAQLLLQAGVNVSLIDPQEAVLDHARHQLRDLFTTLHAKGRLQESPAELLARLRTSTQLADAASSAWIIEAAPEDLALKQELFREVSQLAPKAVLATNTSTLSVTAIAAAAARPETVVGMHFFNPPGLMRLVEVVPGVLTDQGVTDAAVALARRLGREPIVAADSPGFIVNRLARHYYLEALKAHAGGDPVELIDALMRAAGFRQGPFELLDLIGLDVNLAASVGVYRAFFEEPRFRPHPLQQAMVTAGLLGRKSGRGFYRYREDGTRITEPTAASTGVQAQANVAARTGSSPQNGHRDATASPWRLAVIGDGSAAKQLRLALAAGAGTVAVTEADLVFDARLEPAPDEIAALLASGARVAALCWGRSASVAAGSLNAGAYPGCLVGFSLLPGAPSATTTVELMAPLTDNSDPGANDRRLDEFVTGISAAGVACEVVADKAGGVAFKAVAMLANEAIGALDGRLAPAAELDRAMQLGVGYPHGPLAWAQLIGLRELHDALRGMHHETPSGAYAPHPYLTRLVAVGAKSLFTNGAAIEEQQLRSDS